MGAASQQMVDRWSPANFEHNVIQAVETALRIPVPKPRIHEPAFC